jgi:hypothetical protein
VNVLLVAPTSGVKVPTAVLKIPPVPDILFQFPPDSSPEIIENKSIGVVEASLTDISPSIPVFGIGFTVTVKFTGLPKQPLADGNTVYVTDPLLTGLINVRDCSIVFPEPAVTPITLFEIAFHVNVVEGKLEIKSILVVSPSQIIVVGVMLPIIGTLLTITVAELVNGAVVTPSEIIINEYVELDVNGGVVNTKLPEEFNVII